MNKLLIISGPTATGKTALAVKLAKKLHGEIISADSRQIYQELDIGVGKDHPRGTPIHLIDIIKPNQKFSVAEYRQIALSKIYELQSQNKLPILVGCSGFYIDSIINPKYNTFLIKPNKILRNILGYLSINILRFLLKLIDSSNFNKLNHSDSCNPYRLIRKIEIALFKNKLKISTFNSKINILHISLTASSHILYKRIDNRVEERLKMGHLNELKDLLNKYQWTDPGLKVSAYSCFKNYFYNKQSLAVSIQKWKYREHRDARHQKTWFKKRSNVLFVDITKEYINKSVMENVEKWYNKS